MGRRRPRREREGAVMLVVMLIMMVATASAAIAVRTTQSELQAAGQDRLALQTAYVSEAAMMTTLAWVDFLSYQNKWLDVWGRWTAAPAPPSLVEYGEPPIDPANRHYATRTTALDHVASIRPGNGGEVAPLTMPPSGGTVTAFDDATDGVGSFGPKQAYGLAQDEVGIFGYVVDVGDCFQAPAAVSGTAGSPITPSSGGMKQVRFYCVLTARGRLQLPGTFTSRGAETFRPWTFGAATYNQDMLMTAHDSRATILTPEISVPSN